jgi:hypothetical protein
MVGAEVQDQIIQEEEAEVVATAEVVAVATAEITKEVREETMMGMEEIATADVVDGNITKI